MTKSTITRERLEWLSQISCRDDIEDIGGDEIHELARMALAAMDSDPDCKERNLFCSTDTARMRKVISASAGSGATPLYRHAQPAPKTEREPIAWLNDAYLARGVVDGEAGSEDAGPGYIPVYREPATQSAPVVPPMQHWEELCRQYPDMSIRDAIIRAAWWNHCRAAMLQAGNSPVIPNGYVMVPKEPTPEILATITEAIRAMRGSAATYARVLAAAPQEVK